MTARVLEAVADLVRPAAAAQEIARLNTRLARMQTIPPDIVDGVRQISAAVSRTALQRWEQFDPYLALAIHHAAMQADAAARAPTDPAARDRLRVALERLRQAFAAMAENEPIADERSGKEVARWLVDTTGVSQARLAELLGVGLRRFQRWVSVQDTAGPEGKEARRLRVVARLINQLRFSLTPEGAVEWFRWPRPELGGRSPVDVVDEPDRLPLLTAIAAGMRSTAAT